MDWGKVTEAIRAMQFWPILRYRDIDPKELNPHIFEATGGRTVYARETMSTTLMSEALQQYVSSRIEAGKPAYLNAIVLQSDVYQETGSGEHSTPRLCAVCRIPGFDVVPPPTKLASQPRQGKGDLDQQTSVANGFIYSGFSDDTDKIGAAANKRRIAKADWNAIFQHPIYFTYGATGIAGGASDIPLDKVGPGTILKVTFADFQMKTRPEILGINNDKAFILEFYDRSSPKDASTATPNVPPSRSTPRGSTPPSTPGPPPATPLPPAANCGPGGHRVNPHAKPGFAPWADRTFLGKLDCADTTATGKRNHDRNYRAYDCIILHHGSWGKDRFSKKTKAARDGVVRACIRDWIRRGNCSSHYYITLDGTCYVLVDESVVAYSTAGVVSSGRKAGGMGVKMRCMWPDPKAPGSYSRNMRRQSQNTRGIAIDLQGTNVAPQNGFEMEYGTGRPKEGNWKNNSGGYTKAQQDTLVRLLKDINRRRKIPISDTHVLAHFEVQANKNDPVGLGIWDRLMKEFPPKAGDTTYPSKTGIAGNHRLLNHPKTWGGNPRNQKVKAWMSISCNDPLKEEGLVKVDPNTFAKACPEKAPVG